MYVIVSFPQSPQSWLIFIIFYQIFFIYQIIQTRKTLTLTQPNSLFLSLSAIQSHHNSERQKGFSLSTWNSSLQKLSWVSVRHFEMESASAVLGGLQPNYLLTPSRNHSSSSSLLRPFSAHHSSLSPSLKVYTHFLSLPIRKGWIFNWCNYLNVDYWFFVAAPKAAPFGLLPTGSSLPYSPMCHIVWYSPVKSLFFLYWV